MALKWLYSVDREGVRVTPDFMERLQSGNAAALRSLQKRNLTALYRNSFTRAPRRDDAHGLFWSDIPETALIPFVRGGRSRIRPWLPDRSEERRVGCVSTFISRWSPMPYKKINLNKII